MFFSTRQWNRQPRSLWLPELNQPRRNETACCCKYNVLPEIKSIKQRAFSLLRFASKENTETTFEECMSVIFFHITEWSADGQEFEVDPPMLDYLTIWGDPLFLWADHTRARGTLKNLTLINYEYFENLKFFRLFCTCIFYKIGRTLFIFLPSNQPTKINNNLTKTQ